MSVKWAADEIGLSTLVAASADVWIVIVLRMLRLLGFGATSLVLVFFFRELGVDEAKVGAFMTLTFVGDLFTSFFLAVAADKLGRRFTLVMSLVLMTATGLAFVFFNNYYVLVVAAVVGILTPGGGEVGPFRSIEQSAIASLVPAHHRLDIYAWYTFLGTFCAALGSVACGALVDRVQGAGYSVLVSYKAAFAAYSLLSGLSIVLSGLISGRIEVEKPPNEPVPAGNPGKLPRTPNEQAPTERTPSEQTLTEQTPLVPPPVNQGNGFWGIVVKLSVLFALDSFASSLVSNSWQTYYIKNKFHISLSVLGLVFFATGIVSGVFSLFGTTLTKHLGAVVTMVATHLPASILLALVPFPSSLTVTLVILIIRASTQTMDVAPKHVFLATLVPPTERTAVFGWVNLVKTLAQVVGPSIVGSLTNHHLQWISFVAAGSLKAAYDVGILATFLAYNHHNQH